MKRSFEGSVFRLKDKKGWYARVQYVDQDGKRREKRRKCATYGQAKDEIKALQAEIESEKRTGRKTYRQLDQFFREKYVHQARFVNGRKLSGFRQPIYIVQIYLDSALEYFGDRFIEEITYADLQRYKDAIVNRPTIHGKQRSMSDINHYLKRLRRLFNVAVEQGWLEKNPFSRGGSLIDESFEVERTRILSPAEEAALLSQCDKWRKHLKPIIIFAIETGCRRGEIQSLRWQNVNLDARCIKIESHTTKTLKSRLVPISSRLIEVLKEMWRNSPRKINSRLFTSGDFKTSFNKACAEAGLDDVHFHDLRHTAITRMLEKGISPPIVMKISGHTQQRTFLRYVNQSESTIFDIAMRLDQAA